MKKLSIGTVAVGLVLAVPATAPAVSPKARGPHAARDAAKPFYDSRAGARASAPKRGAAARSALKRRLGRQAVVKLNRITGTVSALQRLDGPLSGPAAGDRSSVALGWVRANRTALGLSAADVDALTLADRHVSRASGITHLRYRQAYRGIPAFDNDLRVNLDRGGRLLNVTGAPVSDLRVGSIAPKLDAVAALRALQRNVGVQRAIRVTSRASGARRETRFGADRARLVLFTGANGTRLAWHLTYQATSVALYDAVVDATTGAVLYRQNLVKFDSDATIWPNFPGGELQASPLDGTNAPRAIDLETAGSGAQPWISAGDTQLDGPYSRTYSDVNDDNTPNAGETIPRTAGGDFDHPFTQFDEPPSTADENWDDSCVFDDHIDDWPDPLSPGVLCSWDPTAPTSWQTNRAQNGVQAFYLVNRFHDHLATGPIGFTDDTDGFGGDGSADQDDPVLTETDDGAAVGDDGGPDGDHINNANMATRPDGDSPRMQMYLFAFNPDPDAFFTFRNMNGGDDAGTVWHEYTHGLSNRLVVNDDGTGALSSPHGGAMGEAWSDWYALDLLHRDGLQIDNPDVVGEVDIGLSTDARFTSTRFEPIDCPPTSTSPHCPGGIATGPGGYTLGDFGKVAGAPEVHSDGEIWMQTLWDLRSTLVGALGEDDGSDLAENLVTEGMRLSPPEPSFLDMRNSILAAADAIDPDLHDVLWGVFAGRGMGFYAAVDDSSDTTPIEDFSVPPDEDAGTGTVKGTVTSADTGLPLKGVGVGFAGLTTDASFPDHLATESGGDGTYSLDAPAGSYGSLNFLGSAGFDLISIPHYTVRAGEVATQDAAMRRDWAAKKGGAEVIKDDSIYDNTGGDFGCGLDQLIDQSAGAGNSAFNPDSEDPDNPHLGHPPTALIVLPQAVDVSAFGLDPSNTCGDDESAATKDYKIETSADGVTFNVAKQGSFTPDDLHTLNIVPPDGHATDVKYVRLTTLTPQRAEEGDSGVDFIDFSEIEVFGGPRNVLPSGTLSATPGAVQTGQAVTFDASSFTDPDSKITGYEWDFDGNGTVDRTTETPTTQFVYETAGSFVAKVAAKDFRGGAGQASAGVTVTAAPGGRSGAPALTLPKSGRRGKLSFSVTCPLACTVSGKLTLTQRQARALHLKRRTLRKFTRHLKASVARTITISVGSKAKRAARRHGRKSVVAVLAINATQADHQDKTARRTVRIRL
jgi:extracellular elastinolytic metalloproteinase